MYDIKICTQEDANEIADMAAEFSEQAYPEYQQNEEKILATVDGFLAAPNDQIVIFGLTFDGVLVGCLIAIKQELMFSYQNVAAEVMWWVRPEHRKGRGLWLLDVYEAWAKKTGCVACHLSSVRSSRLDALYRRRKYNQIEQSYMKVL